jgi:hypothetical protein
VRASEIACAHDWLSYFNSLIDKVSMIVSYTPVTTNYRDEFIAAVNELQRLEADYFELGTQIAKQKKKVAALHELADLDDEGLVPIGLVEGITDACRTVFRAADKPLAAFQVKTRVESLGLPPQQNLTASIHTVIRRLVKANEIEEAPPGSGTYQLKLVMPVMPSWLRAAQALGGPDPTKLAEAITRAKKEKK